MDLGKDRLFLLPDAIRGDVGLADHDQVDALIGHAPSRCVKHWRANRHSEGRVDASEIAGTVVAAALVLAAARRRVLGLHIQCDVARAGQHFRRNKVGTSSRMGRALHAVRRTTRDKSYRSCHSRLIRFWRAILDTKHRLSYLRPHVSNILNACVVDLFAMR